MDAGAASDPVTGGAPLFHVKHVSGPPGALREYPPHGRSGCARHLCRKARGIGRTQQPIQRRPRPFREPDAEREGKAGAIVQGGVRRHRAPQPSPCRTPAAGWKSWRRRRSRFRFCGGRRPPLFHVKHVSVPLGALHKSTPHGRSGCAPPSSPHRGRHQPRSRRPSDTSSPSARPRLSVRGKLGPLYRVGCSATALRSRPRAGHQPLAGDRGVDAGAASDSAAGGAHPLFDVKHVSGPQGALHGYPPHGRSDGAPPSSPHRGRHQPRSSRSSDAPALSPSPMPSVRGMLAHCTEWGAPPPRSAAAPVPDSSSWLERAVDGGAASDYGTSGGLPLFHVKHISGRRARCTDTLRMADPVAPRHLRRIERGIGRAQQPIQRCLPPPPLPRARC